jgi:PBP1b-binding outer membrane lipoprotein LpoB
MRRLAVVLVATLVLTACAGWSPARDAAEEYGRKVADETLKAAVWTICKASSVGAIKRLFNTTVKATAWRNFCKEAGAPDVGVIVPDG